MNTDNSEVRQIEERMKSSSKRLHALAPQVGAAKQVRAYDSDRRKALLARHVVRHLKLGESATAADAYARAEDTYNDQLNALAEQYADAEKTISAWDAEYASWESARSLLSWQKETLKQLEG